MTGYTPEEAVGPLVRHLTNSPMNQDVLRRRVLCLQGQQQPPVVAEFPQKDGSRRLLEGSVIVGRLTRSPASASSARLRSVTSHATPSRAATSPFSSKVRVTAEERRVMQGHCKSILFERRGTRANQAKWLSRRAL